MLGLTALGGIDVDSGHGGVVLNPAGRRATTGASRGRHPNKSALQPGQVELVAGKNIRFTPEAPLHTELNIAALPFLWTFITGLTLVAF